MTRIGFPCDLDADRYASSIARLHRSATNSPASRGCSNSFSQVGSAGRPGVNGGNRQQCQHTVGCGIRYEDAEAARRRSSCVK
jgi:hypothetical protein